MYCSNCGAELKEGSAFCEGCGTKREEPQTAASVESVVTPPPPPPPPPAQQQAPPVMAAPPQTPPQQVMHSSPKPPAKSKPPIAIICIAAAVLVVALGIGAYFLFFSGEGGLLGGSSDSDDGGPRVIPNEARIKRELSEDGRSIVPSSQTVESIEVLDEETDRDEWTHHATVLVNSFDEEVNYVKYANMFYTRNEDREWILSSISPERTSAWSTSPRVGAREDLVVSSARDSILWQLVTIDGEEWHIDDSTIENITISNQNTDLNNRKDTVTANVVLGSEAMIAQGQIELEFVFDDGWSFSNYSGSAPFVSEYRPNAVMELSNEQMLDELVRGDATILRDLLYNGQAFTIARDEISNLAVLDYETSDKGANRLYNFSFTAEKGVITYAVDAQVFYHFDSMSGWTPGNFTFTPEVASVELVGTRWLGTYLDYSHTYASLPQTQIIIEITEVTSDGAVRAKVITFTPEISQETIGTFDAATLTLKLMFDEWIVEPSVNPPRNFVDMWKDSHKVDMAGRLSVDGEAIDRTSGARFNVTLTDSLPEPVEVDDDDDDDDD